VRALPTEKSVEAVSGLSVPVAPFAFLILTGWGLVLRLSIPVLNETDATRAPRVSQPKSGKCRERQDQKRRRPLGRSTRRENKVRSTVKEEVEAILAVMKA
jgi:hypothetical protein